MVKGKWCLTIMGNANIKCRLLTRRKKMSGDTYMSQTPGRQL